MVEVQTIPNLSVPVLSRLALELRSGRSTHNAMPDEAGNANGQRPPAAPPIKNRQRDPPVFNGAPEADVNDWLRSYDRASLHNRWDDTLKLANVVFFLKDTAL